MTPTPRDSNAAGPRRPARPGGLRAGAVWVLVLITGGLAATCEHALARQDDQRLPALFEELQGARSDDEADRIERGIWEIWTDSGRADVNALMDKGIEAMNARLFSIALEVFDRVVELDPQFAEGWNKRATVHWLMDHNADSMLDIRRTLALEPRHFGAISGMGLILMERGDARGALKAFEAVLAINPHARGARQHVERLRRVIRGNAV